MAWCVRTVVNSLSHARRTRWSALEVLSMVVPIWTPHAQVPLTPQPTTALWLKHQVSSITCVMVSHPSPLPAMIFNQYQLCLLSLAGKPSCEISGSTDLFGDPCPNANKYLSVSFACEGMFFSENGSYIQQTLLSDDCNLSMVLA